MILKISLKGDPWFGHAFYIHLWRREVIIVSMGYIKKGTHRLENYKLCFPCVLSTEWSWYFYYNTSL